MVSSGAPTALSLLEMHAMLAAVGAPYSGERAPQPGLHSITAEQGPSFIAAIQAALRAHSLPPAEGERTETPSADAALPHGGDDLQLSDTLFDGTAPQRSAPSTH
eukprot:TRINITY_DN19085_c0_g1_i1.p5 TRINITY_DN19085_c0_g1~~TRINITY_DN19085_c0_g1_i1.p5  ORF type:complete len:105 (+),score=18.55 TRINITY_DN19085_c0_g1_i1:383-697(+)